MRSTEVGTNTTERNAFAQRRNAGRLGERGTPLALVEQRALVVAGRLLYRPEGEHICEITVALSWLRERTILQ